MNELTTAEIQANVEYGNLDDDELRDVIKMLLDKLSALKPYALHKANCDVNYKYIDLNNHGKCDCGLQDLLDK